MNVPPGYNQPSNVPPGYGAPQGQYTPPSGYSAMPQSGPYMPPPQPHGFRGATRMMFNPAAYRQAGSGSWAAASLTMAIVGWVTLGCLGIILWPLGLLFGLIGLIGNKRAKGLSFAGFCLNAAGLACIIGFFSLGFYVNFFQEKYASQGAGPVVAAINEYKKDHEGKVPPTLEALVNDGYLPARWTTGLDDLDSHVRGVVEGKEWKEFLEYAPAGGGASTPAPSKRSGRKAMRGSDWMEGHDTIADEEISEAEPNATSYTLKFIGVDGKWGSSDDQLVNQNPEAKYDLGLLRSGNRDVLQKLTQTKRELAATLKDLDAKIKRYETEIPKEENRLRTQEDALRKLIREKDLRDINAVKKDAVGKERLALIGETRARLTAYNAKLRQLKDQREIIAIKVERLEGQESMAKMAESKDDMAKLDQLLEEAKKTLGDADDTSSFMGESQKEKEAEEWYKEQNFGE